MSKKTLKNPAIKALILFFSSFEEALTVIVHSPVNLNGRTLMGGVNYVIWESENYVFFSFGSYISAKLFNIISEGKDIITDYMACCYRQDKNAYEVFSARKGSVVRTLYVLPQKNNIYKYKAVESTPVIIEGKTIKEGSFSAGMAQAIFLGEFDIFNIKNEYEYIN